MLAKKNENFLNDNISYRVKYINSKHYVNSNKNQQNKLTDINLPLTILKRRDIYCRES